MLFGEIANNFLDCIGGYNFKLYQEENYYSSKYTMLLLIVLNSFCACDT